MALMRSWAVGILVLVISEYVQIRVVYDNLVGPEGVGSFAAALAFVHVPNLLCVRSRGARCPCAMSRRRARCRRRGSC